jgi:hypothetical protein
MHGNAMPALKIAIFYPQGCIDAQQAPNVQLVSKRESEVTHLPS